MDFEALLNRILSSAASVCAKIIFALIVYFVGRAIIKRFVKALGKGKLFAKAEGTVKTFTISIVKITLNVVLIISIITILGVPMASVITVLASAGVAIGMALQGALSNLAGGIMLMVFKPFKIGDYVEAAGTAGIVKELTLFYTVLTTWDNQTITVPNGSLMNSNVVNCSTAELRRVDLSFSCAKSETPTEIQKIMLDAVNSTAKVLNDPAPFARLSDNTNESMVFSVRAWCKNEDYWDVYFDMLQKVTEALIAKGVKAPAARVINEVNTLAK